MLRNVSWSVTKPEVIEKQRIAQTGKKRSEKAKQNNRLAQLVAQNRPEVKKKHEIFYLRKWCQEFS